MKNLLTILGLVLFTGMVFSQDEKSAKEQHMALFKTLAANGGIWISENPKYDSSKPNDYKEYILKVTQKDPLQIDAEILGVNTKQDTIKFWIFTEFYAPDKQKNIFFQRSADGNYYAMGEATMTTTERYCEMSFYHSKGEYLRHKDTHTLVSENEMQSISFDYDPESKKWINKSVLIWKREN